MSIYEWDDTKELFNREKHGFGFELIFRFDWNTALVRSDTRFDYGEERMIAYGRIDLDGYAVVYVRRDDHIRIISLRRAHDKELRRYGL